MMFRKPRETEETVNSQKNHLKPKRKVYKKVLLGFFIGVFLAGIFWFSINILLAAKKIFTPNLSGGSAWFLSKLGANKLKGEGDGRINILLLGMGGQGHPGGSLTDTIMLASINPDDKSVVLLSIPRDLQVPIKGVGTKKINYAHAYGEMNQKQTGGGPALAKETASEILDLPIHYFVRADFSGFTKLVNEVGGVDIYVDKAIYDPYYPATDMVGYQPFSMKAGQQHMNGETALKYVRSRETTSDFDRSKRQQKLITAWLNKALSLGILANPSKILSIANILGDHLKTDMQVWEMERLIGILKDVKQQNIALKVLDTGEDGLLTSTGGVGGYYLVPKSGNFKDIQKFVHEFLKDPLLEKENAKIEIQNGTAKPGFASEVAQTLKSYGYNVVKIKDAPTPYVATTIYDYTAGGKPNTIAFLKKRLNVSQVKNGVKSETDADILVILGQNYQENN